MLYKCLSYILSGDPYSVMGVHGGKAPAAAPAANEESPRPPSKKERARQNYENNRNNHNNYNTYNNHNNAGRGRGGSRGRGRSDRDRNYVGAFCGKFNSGAPCDGSCGRRHHCNRYVDGDFCGADHASYEHS